MTPRKTETFLVKLKDITVGRDRGRKQFGKILELAESLKERGFIHPIYVTEDPNNPGKYLLVAGERRYRAASVAGFEEVPVTFSSQLSTLDQKIIELEENIYRLDIDWQEQAEIHRQINEARKLKDSRWTQKQTAEQIGITPGTLSAQITVAERLRQDPELKKKIRNLDFRSALKVIKRSDESDRVERLVSQGKLKLTTDLKLGDCRELLKTLPTGSVDMLLTDPPYGLAGLNEISKGDGSVMQGHALMSQTHNLTLPEVLMLLSDIAPELHRVLKPGSHMYVFAPFEYVGDFIEALKPFQFQPPLLIWDRGRNTMPGYGYQYLNRTEAIIYGHNPPRGKRLAKNMYNIFEEPTVPNSLRVYPTEKPQSLLKTLIMQSTITNDLVLDPFAGSASTLKAARSCARRSLGFEIQEEAFNRAQLSLTIKEDDEKDLFDNEDDE